MPRTDATDTRSDPPEAALLGQWNGHHETASIHMDSMWICRNWWWLPEDGVCSGRGRTNHRHPVTEGWNKQDGFFCVDCANAGLAGGKDGKQRGFELKYKSGDGGGWGRWRERHPEKGETTAAGRVAVGQWARGGTQAMTDEIINEILAEKPFVDVRAMPPGFNRVIYLGKLYGYAATIKRASRASPGTPLWRAFKSLELLAGCYFHGVPIWNFDMETRQNWSGEGAAKRRKVPHPCYTRATPMLHPCYTHVTPMPQVFKALFSHNPRKVYDAGIFSIIHWKEPFEPFHPSDPCANTVFNPAPASRKDIIYGEDVMASVTAMLREAKRKHILIAHWFGAADLLAP